MATKTYAFALDPSNPFVQRGVTRFLTWFKEGSRVRSRVAAAHFDLAPGDTVTTDEPLIQRALEGFTDDTGTPMFAETVTPVRDTDLGAHYDRYRTERVR